MKREETMKSIQDIKQKIELATYSRDILGKTIRYSLLEAFENGEKQYYIAVESIEDFCSCGVGSDLIDAVYLLDAIIKGQIFPYSLPEIVDDFHKM